MTRYWQNVYSNWIESELLFEIVNGPYDDVFVFDKYAITIKDKNKVNAVFYDNFKGAVIASNYEASVYDDLQFTSDTFENVAFWDYTGQGDFRMLAAIKSQGAVTLYLFESDIQPEGANPSGDMTR